jgi:hypothetical protein
MAILSQNVRLSFLLCTNLAILQVEKKKVLNAEISPRAGGGGRVAVKETPTVYQLVEWFRF